MIPRFSSRRKNCRDIGEKVLSAGLLVNPFNCCCFIKIFFIVFFFSCCMMYLLLVRRGTGIGDGGPRALASLLFLLRLPWPWLDFASPGSWAPLPSSRCWMSSMDNTLICLSLPCMPPKSNSDMVVSWPSDEGTRLLRLLVLPRNADGLDTGRLLFNSLIRSFSRLGRLSDSTLLLPGFLTLLLRCFLMEEWRGFLLLLLRELSGVRGRCGVPLCFPVALLFGCMFSASKEIIFPPNGNGAVVSTAPFSWLGVQCLGVNRFELLREDDGVPSGLRGV